MNKAKEKYSQNKKSDLLLMKFGRLKDSSISRLALALGLVTDVGALLSLLRSDYKQQPSGGRFVIGKKTRSSIVQDASTSGNEIHVGRTLRDHLSTLTTTTTTTTTTGNNNNNHNNGGSASGTATVTRTATGSTSNRRRSSIVENNDDYVRSYTSNNNNTTTSREVVFPDSFEVLPQPRDLSIVYMDVPHEQQRKFRCRFCGKGYRWKSTMRRHEMVECGGKPPAFQCPECPYKARQRGNLTVHYKRHHLD